MTDNDDEEADDEEEEEEEEEEGEGLRDRRTKEGNAEEDKQQRRLDKENMVLQKMVSISCPTSQLLYRHSLTHTLSHH